MVDTINDDFSDSLEILARNPKIPTEFGKLPVGINILSQIDISDLSVNFKTRVIYIAKENKFFCENCREEMDIEKWIVIDPRLMEYYRKPEILCVHCVYKVFEDILLEILEREDFYFKNLLNLDCEETIESVKELEDGISFLTFFRIVDTLWNFNRHVHLNCIHCGNQVPKDTMVLIDDIGYTMFEHENLEINDDISYENKIYLPIFCRTCYNLYENAHAELINEHEYNYEIVEVLTNYTPFTAESVSNYRESYDEAWIRRVYSSLDPAIGYEESVLLGKEYRIYKGHMNFDKISENLIASNDERDIFNILASRHTCYNPNSGSCSNAYRVCSENNDYIVLIKNPDNGNIYDIILRHVDSDLYYIEPFAYEALTYSEQYSEKICSSKILSNEDINELQKKLHIKIYSSELIGFYYEGVIRLSESIFVDKDSRTESEIEIKKEKKYEEFDFLEAQFFVFDKRFADTANCREIIQASLVSTEKKIEKIFHNVFAVGKPNGKYIIGTYHNVVKTNLKQEIANFIIRNYPCLNVEHKLINNIIFISVENINEICNGLSLTQASVIHELIETFPNSYLNFKLAKRVILFELEQIKNRKPNEMQAFSRLVETLAIANHYPFIKKYLEENNISLDNFKIP